MPQFRSGFPELRLKLLFIPVLHLGEESLIGVWNSFAKVGMSQIDLA
jgi:hypothetical protein